MSKPALNNLMPFCLPAIHSVKTDGGLHRLRPGYFSALTALRGRDALHILESEER